jgi:hypothetical protein
MLEQSTGTVPFSPYVVLGGRKSRDLPVQAPIAIGTTLHLSPGRYSVTVSADAQPTTDVDHGVVTARPITLLP